MYPDTLQGKQRAIPRDTHNNALQLTIPTPAIARTRDESISTSTEITLNALTSFIEINAIDGNVYLKYGTTDVTNANFDEFILAGGTRHYVIPEDPSTGALFTAINLIDDGDSAKVIVIEK